MAKKKPLAGKMERLPIVEITWWDACTSGGWKKLSTYVNEHSLAECMVVGYLSKNTRKEVQVLQQRGELGDVSDSVTIPKSCVKRIRVLRRG